MISHPSSKQGFLYPKFLKPLGASVIAGFDPVSLFPNGIPGYVAPKSQNFADSPFFFHNRSIEIAEPNSQPQVRFKNQTPDFSLTPSVTQQEVNDENREIDNLSQSDRTINLKSNIAPDSASNLSKVELHKNENITPTVDNLIINQETVTPQSDNIFDITSSHKETITSFPPKVGGLGGQNPVNKTFQIPSDTDKITPSIKPSSINPETLTPQSDNISKISTPKNDRITPSIKNPIINPETRIPQSDNRLALDLPESDNTTPLIQPPPINPEIIAPQSNNDSDVVSTKTDNITSAIENPNINQETVTSQSDNISDITSSHKETITPFPPKAGGKPGGQNPENKTFQISSYTDNITPSIKPPPINPEVITPQSDNMDVDSTNSDRITPTRENLVIKRETITPQSDNISDITSSHKETITPFPPKAGGKPGGQNPENKTFQISSYTDNITPSIKPSSISQETITPQSNNADAASAKTDDITSTKENPIINRETIKPQSDNYSDVASAGKETITPPVENSIINQQPVTSESNHLSNVELPDQDKITPSIQPSLISQEIITPQSDKVSDINSAKTDKITPAIDKPIINRETVTTQSDNITDISATNLESNNNSISTPEITPQSKKIKSFSLISILRKAIAFFSPDKKSLPETEESRDMRSRLPSSDIITPKSQPSKNISNQPTVFKRWLNIASLINRSFPTNKTVNTKSKTEPIEENRVDLEDIADIPQVASNKRTIPDRWSSIAELINQPSPTNDAVNAKSDADSLEENKINLENVGGTKQASNKSEPSLVNKLPKLPKNYPIQSSKSQGQNLDIDRDNRVYKVQLSPENTTRSGYEYQSLSPKTTIPEKTSFDKPSIQENNNSTLSRTEDVGSELETGTENIETTENNETKATENESELLEVLAGEIYHLLQQRLELERERQGKYYL